MATAMARNRAFIAAAPEHVFAVLSDPNAYGDWVVGSHSIRDADASWPSVGSRFHHRVGVGPLTVADHTEVLEVDPPRRLVLRARARPLANACVELRLTAVDGGTEVTMLETAADTYSRLGLNRLTDPLLRWRNRIALTRLRRIAEAGPVTPGAAGRPAGD
jgi:uncharacterized protein YndB with AHSA1/START domain